MTPKFRRLELTPEEIIEFIPHTVQWDLKFCQDEVKKHGVGTVEKINFKFIANSHPYVIDLTNS